MSRLGKAAAVSAALSALFLLVYGSCIWITSLRPHVGSFYFAWERHIPFVPAMIVPYMSIDLFFVAAPFLATSARELRALSLRIATAILAAGACFLTFPLRFAFARPRVDGALGFIFNGFRALDPPFNESPCLHVALLIILGDIYLRRTRGAIRWMLAGWFALIAISPLFTYQHHLPDLIAGLALALTCLHLISDEPVAHLRVHSARLAVYYGVGAALALMAAFAVKPWSLLLLWPALSMAVVAAGYGVLGPGIYRKTHGRLAWSTPWLLGPVLLGQHLSLLYYARQCRPRDQIDERLWIGRRLSQSQARQARAEGILAVIDLTAEFTEPRAFREGAYLHLPVLDLTAPTQEQLREAVAFIRLHGASGPVYVHCKIGYSRTAAVGGAFLLASGQAQSVEEAVAAMRRVRPSMIIRPEAKAALHEFLLSTHAPDGHAGRPVAAAANQAHSPRTHEMPASEHPAQSPGREPTIR